VRLINEQAPIDQLLAERPSPLTLERRSPKMFLRSSMGLCIGVLAASLATSGCISEWHVGDGWEEDDEAVTDCPDDDDDDPDDCGSCSGCGPCGGPTHGAPACPDPHAAGVSYVSDDRAVCDAIQFACREGLRFDASCGCGCALPVPAPPECPGAADARFSYASTDADQCAETTFGCADGDTPFTDECGCGCVAPAPAPACPDPNDPKVSYVSQDPAICAQINVTCGEACTAFDDTCGCGCIAP
jgi:hypothetical protein